MVAHAETWGGGDEQCIGLAVLQMPGAERCPQGLQSCCKALADKGTVLAKQLLRGMQRLAWLSSLQAPDADHAAAVRGKAGET